MDLKATPNCDEFNVYDPSLSQHSLFIFNVSQFPIIQHPFKNSCQITNYSKNQSLIKKFTKNKKIISETNNIKVTHLNKIFAKITYIKFEQNSYNNKFKQPSITIHDLRSRTYFSQKPVSHQVQAKNLETIFYPPNPKQTSQSKNSQQRRENPAGKIAVTFETAINLPSNGTPDASAFESRIVKKAPPYFKNITISTNLNNISAWFQGNRHLSAFEQYFYECGNCRWEKYVGAQNVVEKSM